MLEVADIQQPLVAAVLPTRGLFFAKMIEGVIRNGYILQGGISLMIDESGNGYPMPECFNKGIAQSLATDCTHILIVEEDNEVPDGIVESMLNFNKPIVVVEYPMGKGQTSITRKKDGTITSSGIGLCLIHRDVFEAVKYPWFEVDKVIDAKSGAITTLPEHQVAKKYGGHDPLFFKKAKESGYEISVLPNMTARHFRAKEITKLERNAGTYTIYSL